MKKVFLSVLLSTLLILFTACKAQYINETDENLLGTEVYLSENNELVPYIIISTNYSGDKSDNTNILLLRKYVMSKLQPYSDDYWYSKYEDSYIDKYLNNDVYNLYSDNVKNTIVSTTIITQQHNTINRNVFLLSSSELGSGNSDNKLNYFYNDTITKRTASKDNETEPCAYWLRDRYYDEPNCAWSTNNGKLGSGTATDKNGVRPAICISKNTIFQEKEINGIIVRCIE